MGNVRHGDSTAISACRLAGQRRHGQRQWTTRPGGNLRGHRLICQSSPGSRMRHGAGGHLLLQPGVHPGQRHGEFPTYRPATPLMLGRLLRHIHARLASTAAGRLQPRRVGHARAFHPNSSFDVRCGPACAPGRRRRWPQHERFLHWLRLTPTGYSATRGRSCSPVRHRPSPVPLPGVIWFCGVIDTTLTTTDRINLSSYSMVAGICSSPARISLRACRGRFPLGLHDGPVRRRLDRRLLPWRRSDRLWTATPQCLPVGGAANNRSADGVLPVNGAWAAPIIAIRRYPRTGGDTL